MTKDGWGTLRLMALLVAQSTTLVHVIGSDDLANATFGTGQDDEERNIPLSEEGSARANFLKNGK
jgi:hypothetical protein